MAPCLGFYRLTFLWGDDHWIWVSRKTRISLVTTCAIHSTWATASKEDTLVNPVCIRRAPSPMGLGLRWQRVFCILCPFLGEQRCSLTSIWKKGSGKVCSECFLKTLLPKHTCPWDSFFDHSTHYHPGAHRPNDKVQNLRLAFGACPTGFIGQPLSSPAARTPLHILNVLLLQGPAHSCLHLLGCQYPSATCFLKHSKPPPPFPQIHCWLLLPSLSIPTPGRLSFPSPPFQVISCCSLGALGRSKAGDTALDNKPMGAGLSLEAFSEPEPPLSAS